MNYKNTIGGIFFLRPYNATNADKSTFYYYVTYLSSKLDLNLLEWIFIVILTEYSPF